MPIAEKPTMQNRFAYLFELDSVRTSDAEICAGQQALWNEIVSQRVICCADMKQYQDDARNPAEPIERINS